MPIQSAPPQPQPFTQMEGSPLADSGVEAARAIRVRIGRFDDIFEDVSQDDDALAQAYTR